VRNRFGAKALSDIFKNRKMRKNRIALKHSVDLAAISWSLVKALAGHPDFAAIQLFKTCNQAEQSGLARAALTEDGQKFARSNVERKSAQDRAFGELFFDSTNGKQRLRSSLSRGSM
jgi:hypothetical protein